MNIKITKEQIEQCFDGKIHQGDVMVNLYKIAIPEFDNVEKLSGWPSVSEPTWKYICELFIKFDKKHHPNVIAGGCWMNSGFAIEKMADFEILPIDPDKITWKGDHSDKSN